MTQGDRRPQEFEKGQRLTAMALNAIVSAVIARKNTAGNYEITTQEETVTNRFENISLDAGTLVGIEWIDGEWQPYKADCSPQSESIPGGSAMDSLLENQPPGGPSPP